MSKRPYSSDDGDSGGSKRMALDPDLDPDPDLEQALRENWNWVHDPNGPDDILQSLLENLQITDSSGSSGSSNRVNENSSSSSSSSSSNSRRRPGLIQSRISDYFSVPSFMCNSSGSTFRQSSDKSSRSVSSSILGDVNVHNIVTPNVVSADPMQQFHVEEQEYGLLRGLLNVLPPENVLSMNTCSSFDRPLYRAFHSHSNQVAGGAHVYGGKSRDYRLETVSKRQFKRFGAERTNFRLVLEPPDPERVLTYEEEVKNIRTRLESVIRDIQRTVDPQDWFGLLLSNNNFAKGNVWITRRRADQLDSNAIMDMFEKAFQSNDMTLFQDLFTLTTVRIKFPEGSGLGGPRRWRKLAIASRTVADMLRRKSRSLVFINNTDHTCLARAAVIGMAYADGETLICNTLQADQKYQTLAAKRLMDSVGIEDRPCTLEDVKAISEYYSGEYQFIVRDLHGFVYKDSKPSSKQVILFHDASVNHYHTILSLAGFLGVGHFCVDCNVQYDERRKHKCTRGCKSCGLGQGNCKPSPNGSIRCKVCNRYFFSRTCFDHHLKRKLCDQVYRCGDCGALVNVKTRVTAKKSLVAPDQLKNHQCGEVFCVICSGYYLPPHFCYMLPVRKDKEVVEEEEEGEALGNSGTTTVSYDLIEENEMKSKRSNVHTTMFLFYDFETTQETVVPPKSVERIDNHHPDDLIYEHEVNFAVVKQRCEYCARIDTADDAGIELPDCRLCGPERKRVFTGKDALSQFCHYVFDLSQEQGFTVIAIAHNSSGFDAQFILQHCFSRGVKPSKFLANGTKIMSMSVGGASFIDSFRFLPMSLRALPRAFGLTSLSKGDFPHLFNRTENWNYVGPIPDFKYYGPDTRSSEEKHALLSWWVNQRESGYLFNFQKEIRMYCEMDVDILEQACIRFRKLFMSAGGVDPFAQSVTIASACSLLFRKNFLLANTIAVVHPKGYSFRDTQSHAAKVWLLWEEKQRGIRIVHSVNDREARLLAGHFVVDGYYEPKKLVFEFQGCAYHGCPTCFSTNASRKRMVPNSRTRTMETAYEDTVLKVCTLTEAGYDVIEKWECEFRKEVQTDLELKRFWEAHHNTSPLNPRDAFFGGRTNAIRLYYKVKPNERMRYMDVCSLYPWVNKYGKYPIGHPRALLSPNLGCDVRAYEGFVKCKVLPPTSLFHPVLPVRIEKKLVFPLCLSCATELEQKCLHTDEERALKGTWVSDELRLAVDKGYRVMEVYEVWHFDKHQICQYDPHAGTAANPALTRGLFRDYVDHFLKIKAEASGFPKWVKDESAKHAYVDMYRKHEGIQLDVNKIEVNPGLRSIAKLALNSFWGKFGQRSNLDQVEYMSHPEQLRSFLLDETKEITGVCFPCDELAQLQWRHTSDFVEPYSLGNPFIAAYTTAQARMKLYSYLDRLQERVLYFDTDSVIYITGPNDRDLETGMFLGQLTDELESYGDGAYISEFVSAGPKNYAYTIVNKAGERVDGVCKVKGITLNAKNAASVNFETMKEMVTGTISSELVLQDERIVRSKDHRVLTKKEKKTWRVVYRKRILRDDLSTVPFGYNV
jgi:G:T-mismatch repair DNA endonuclease (very short patch repair protein)